MLYFVCSSNMLHFWGASSAENTTHYVIKTPNFTSEIHRLGISWRISIQCRTSFFLAANAKVKVNTITIIIAWGRTSRYFFSCASKAQTLMKNFVLFSERMHLEDLQEDLEAFLVISLAPSAKKCREKINRYPCVMAMQDIWKDFRILLKNIAQQRHIRKFSISSLLKAPKSFFSIKEFVCASTECTLLRTSWISNKTFCRFFIYNCELGWAGWTDQNAENSIQFLSEFLDKKTQCEANEY